MEIEDLAPKAQVKLLKKITDGLLEFAKNNPDSLALVLEDFIMWLDDMDGNDAWGTEGWKHTFGIED